MAAQSLSLLPAAGGAIGGLRVTAQPPEPGRLWIRYAPRAWEGPDRPWLDLAAGRLGRSRAASGAAGSGRSARGSGDQSSGGAGVGSGDRASDGSGSSSGSGGARGAGAADREQPAEGSNPPPPRLDDLLYLPPVAGRRAAERDALAAAALAGGTPVLIQLLLGDEAAAPAVAAAAGAVVVVDLLAALLAGEVDRLAAAPAGAAAAVWPLLPGLTDDPGLWQRGCESLAAAGLTCLVALVPALEPGDRRRLAQGAGDAGQAFDALFHQPAPGERELARVAHRRGLAPFLSRPLPLPPQGRAENRRLAGLLALAGDLWLRVGRRPVEQAQALFRAARWLDATAYDVEALSREGNLAVVTALDPLARGAIAEAAGGAEPGLLAGLMAEYLG